MSPLLALLLSIARVCLAGVQLESGDEDSNAVRAVQRDVAAFLEELQACKGFLQGALPRLNTHFKKLDKIKGAAGKGKGLKKGLQGGKKALAQGKKFRTKPKE